MSNAKVAAGCFGVFTLLTCLGAGAAGGIFFWLRASPPDLTMPVPTVSPSVPVPSIVPPSAPVVPEPAPVPEPVAVPTPVPEPTPVATPTPEPVAVPEPARVAPPSTPREAEPEATPTRRGTTMATARTGQLSADDF